MPNTFTLTMNTENDAFTGQDCVPEVCRILRKLADQLQHNGLGAKGDQGRVRDINGNSVGGWRYYNADE